MARIDNANLDAIKELLFSETSPAYMAKDLSILYHKLIQYFLMDSDLGGPLNDYANSMYSLNRMIYILLKTAKDNNEENVEYSDSFYF